MLQSKNKVSSRQVMLMAIVLEFASAVRITLRYTAKIAKQAAWLSGILSIIPALLIIFIFKTFINNKNYNEADMTDIVNDIMGNIFGRIITVVYFLWIMLILSINIRSFSERMVSNIMPNTSTEIFIVSMLVVVGLALSSGVTVLARMGEIIILITVFIIYVLFLFGLPFVKVENITPIYFTDILPAFQGSMVLWYIYGYTMAFSFFGSQINDKEKIVKFGVRKAFFSQITNTLMKVFTVGALGWSLTARITRPYFAFVKIIAVFGVVERLESVLVIILVLSDFMIISVFTYAALSLIKSFFCLNDYKFLIIPLLTLSYFLALLLVSNEFELENLSISIVYTSILLEYVIPILIIMVGKLRKKI